VYRGGVGHVTGGEAVLRLPGVPGHDQHIPTIGSQAVGDGAADPAGAAGYDGLFHCGPALVSRLHHGVVPELCAG
jgi:hypothetical protein